MGNAGVTIKTDVSFYQLEHGKNDFKLLSACNPCRSELLLTLSFHKLINFKILSSPLFICTETLSARTSNTIRWSPRGRHVVLATVGSPSKSELEFWDLDFNVDDIVLRRDNHPSKEEWGSGIQHLGTADHYGVTDVEWDPSGRYLATSASVWRHTVSKNFPMEFTCRKYILNGRGVLITVYTSYGSWRTGTRFGTLKGRKSRNTFWIDSSSSCGARDLRLC